MHFKRTFRFTLFQSTTDNLIVKKQSNILLYNPLPDLSQSKFPDFPDGKDFYEYDLVVFGKYI